MNERGHIRVMGLRCCYWVKLGSTVEVRVARTVCRDERAPSHSASRTRLPG